MWAIEDWRTASASPVVIVINYSVEGVAEFSVNWTVTLLNGYPILDAAGLYKVTKSVSAGIPHSNNKLTESVNLPNFN